MVKGNLVTFQHWLFRSALILNKNSALLAYSAVYDFVIVKSKLSFGATIFIVSPNGIGDAQRF